MPGVLEVSDGFPARQASEAKLADVAIEHVHALRPEIDVSWLQHSNAAVR